MTKNIPLVVTAIPSTIGLGCKPDPSSNPLFISLSIHPQLPLRGADITLGNHYKKLWNWHEYIEFFKGSIRFEVLVYSKEFKKVDSGDITGNYFDAAGQNAVNESSVKDLFQNMFSYDTPVSHFFTNKVPFTIVDAITRDKIHLSVIKAINQCINRINFDVYNSSTGIISIDSILVTNSLELSAYLQELKDFEIESILSDPILTDTRNPYLAPLLQELNIIYTAFKAELTGLITQMTATELEDHNLNELNEFHKKFTAYAQHPELLRRTGFLFKYKIENPGTLQELNIKYPTQDYYYFILAGKGDFNADTSPKINSLITATKPEIFWRAFLDEIDTLFPLTYFTYDDIGFRVAPMPPSFFSAVSSDNNKATAATKSAAHILPLEGFKDYVDVTNSAFSIRSRLIDRKQLFQKIEAQLTSKPLINDDTEIQVGEHSIPSIEKNVKYPSNRKNSTGYNASGITVAIDNLHRVVEAALTYTPDENKDLFKSIQDTAAMVFAHNLQNGYRVDVISLDLLDNLQVGSLCWKAERYYRLDGNTVPIQQVVKTEGWVGESIQLTNTKSLYIDEEIFKWNDWDLVTQIGGTQPDASITDGSFYIETAAHEHSLVPLRYGRIYSFALRPTDICGNSAPDIETQLTRMFDKNDLCLFLQGQAISCINRLPACARAACEKIDKVFTPPIKYLRVDGIHAPKVDYVDQTNGNKNEATPQKNILSADELASDLVTLVVRSIDKGGSLGIVANNDVRLLSPPRVSLQFVIQHGLLDEEFALCQFDPARREKVIEHLIAMDEIEKKKEGEAVEPEILDRNAFISYLTDPLADGFEIVMDNHSYTTLLGLAPRKENIASWNIREHYPLVLEPVEDIAVGQNDLALDLEATVKLRQGHEKEIQIACAFEAGFNNMATTDLFLPGIQKVQYTHLTLIHAVQRPCLLSHGYDGNNICNSSNNFKELIDETSFHNNRLLIRKPGTTDIPLLAAFDYFPVLTADTYTLFIQYIDIIPDRTAEHGYWLAIVNKAVKKGILPTKLDDETNVQFAVTHPITDTRYYRINYYIEALSKYRHYFEQEIAAPTNNQVNVFGLTTTRKPFAKPFDSGAVYSFLQLKGYLQEIYTGNYFNVPSAGKPPVLLIDKIVPVMEWVETATANGFTVERFCNTFRLYFDCDWYQTGWEEKVAILYLDPALNPTFTMFDSGNTLNPIKDPEQSLSKVISQYGSDPISIKQGVSGIINASFFKDTTAGQTVRLKDLDFDKEKFNSNATDELGNILLSSVICPVHFANAMDLNKINGSEPGRKDYTTQGKFYVDIKIDNEKLNLEYFPFLRFAIARYQEHTIEVSPGNYAYNFSKVLVTDFVQPLPYRKFGVSFSNKTVTINWDARNKSRQTEKDLAYRNEVYLLEDPAIAEVAQMINPEGESNLSNVLGGVKSDEYKLENVAFNSAASLTLTEYECFPNNKDGLTAPEVLDKLNSVSPRDDINRRLIFSYNFLKAPK